MNENKVVRALIEVQATGGETEWVTITVSPQGVHAQSAAGDTSGPAVQAALAAFAPALSGASAPSLPVPHAFAKAAGEAPSSRVAERLRSIPPPRETMAPPRAADGDSTWERELAVACEDIVTSVARVGVAHAAAAASVRAAIERAVELAPQPTPAGLSRFLLKLKRALAERDVAESARLLLDASRFAADLRAPERPSTRLSALLGDARARDRAPISDRVMVEVARAQRDGLERSEQERRILVDVGDGTVFVEARRRGETASLGPCPREVHVGFAEVCPGPEPRELRVLQYEVRSGPSPASLRAITDHAARSVREVSDGYDRARREHPGQAEPVVVFAPARCSRDGGLCLHDIEGGELQLLRSPSTGRAASLEALTDARDPEWIVGELRRGEGDALALDPWGACVRGEHTLEYHRLR